MLPISPHSRQRIACRLRLQIRGQGPPAGLYPSLDLLAEAERISKTAHLGFPQLVLDDCYACRGRPTVTGDYAKRDEAEGAIVRIIDVRGWSYLLSESGLRTFMDARAREQWDRQLAEGDVPGLTTANIEATFAQLHDARGDMFERGVIQCFRRLSWDYKTNRPFKFGKRTIVKYLLSDGCTNHRVTDELDDLIRVFSLLDGKPEPDHRRAAYALVSDAQQARSAEAEHVYFHLRWFKNVNGDLTFKRRELVEQMNLILAKHYPHALAAEHGRSLCLNGADGPTSRHGLSPSLSTRQQNSGSPQTARSAARCRPSNLASYQSQFCATGLGEDSPARGLRS